MYRERFRLHLFFSWPFLVIVRVSTIKNSDKKGISAEAKRGLLTQRYVWYVLLLAPDGIDIDRYICFAKNYSDRYISLAKNLIDRFPLWLKHIDISYAKKKFVDRDIYWAKTFIDREGHL